MQHPTDMGDDDDDCILLLPDSLLFLAFSLFITCNLPVNHLFSEVFICPLQIFHHLLKFSLNKIVFSLFLFSCVSNKTANPHQIRLIHLLSQFSSFFSALFRLSRFIWLIRLTGTNHRDHLLLHQSDLHFILLRLGKLSRYDTPCVPHSDCEEVYCEDNRAKQEKWEDVKKHLCRLCV